MQVLFTCTTYLDNLAGDRLSELTVALQSLQEYCLHDTRVGEWWIINEVSTSGTNWKQLIEAQFPWVLFYQKSPEEQGQATSLNLILQKLRREEHWHWWLQWEESWFVTRPFLAAALDAVIQRPVDQLQLNQHGGFEEWLDWPTAEVLQVGEESFRFLFPRQEIGFSRKGWPLFSLRPGLNNCSFLRGPGAELWFNTDPKAWPGTFEYEFGYEWEKAGGQKAVMRHAPVQRKNSHKSTWFGMVF